MMSSGRVLASGYLLPKEKRVVMVPVMSFKHLIGIVPVHMNVIYKVAMWHTGYVVSVERHIGLLILVCVQKVKVSQLTPVTTIVCFTFFIDFGLWHPSLEDTLHEIQKSEKSFSAVRDECNNIIKGSGRTHLAHES